MDRDEAILEASVDTLMLRCQDLKQSISAFIYKLETEYEIMNWQSFLDNFALISGQINNMMKVIRNERTPPYKDRIVLPLLLSPDQDDELVKLTEGRVMAFNHEACPDYLRTKPIPDVELNERKINDKLNKISPDVADKMILNSNKIVQKLLDNIRNTRDSWNTESLQTVGSFNQTSSQADTNIIVSAISNGKGILPATEPIQLKTTPATIPQQTQQPIGRASNKGIKTNIKAGAKQNF